MWCIYWVFEWMISPVFSIVSVLSYFTCPLDLYTLKTNDLTHWSSFIKRRVYYMCTWVACMNDITCTYLMLVWMISQVLSIISVFSCLTCPYTLWKQIILLTGPSLSTVLYIRCTNWMFVWMISTVLSIINVLSYFTCPHPPLKRKILPIDQLLSTVGILYVHIGCLYERSHKISPIDQLLSTLWYIQPKSYQQNQ